MVVDLGGRVSAGMVEWRVRFFQLQMVLFDWQTIIGLEIYHMAQKRAWTEEEDMLLKLVFETSQLTKWSHIARRLQEEHGVRGRNGKQCKERYITHIDTSHPKEEWSYSDEQRMFDLHNELGNKWAIIGSKLEGRSDNCVKNHFYSKLRKALRKINRVVQTNYKKQLKEFKPNILYRIVQVSEENFKSVPSYEKNFTTFSHQLKNQLFQFSYDDQVGGNQADFENINIEQANELIDKLNQFSLNYKKKAKKQRRCSDTGQDLLTPHRYQQKPRCNSENEESDPSSNIQTDPHLDDISDEVINSVKPIKRARKSSQECTGVLLDRMRTRAFSQGSQNISTESNTSSEMKEERDSERIKRENAELEGALDGLHILQEEEPPHPLMMKKETSKYSENAAEREDFHFFEDSQIEMRILPQMDLGFHRDSQFDDNIFIM